MRGIPLFSLRAASSMAYGALEDCEVRVSRLPTKKVGATHASLGATVYPTRQRQATPYLRSTTSILVHAVIRHS
jgi:hypothetical protein